MGGRYVQLGLVMLAFFLSGCAATQVALEKKDLDVQTKMSDSIFLDPVGPDKRTIFVHVRNTSDKSNFEIMGPIREAMHRKGYVVTDNPDAAHYILQANVLACEKSSPSAAQVALRNGYGGPLTGAVAGATVGGATHGWRGAYVGGAVGSLVGGATEVAANSLVKDVTFVVVTDIEIAERAKEGVVVRQDSRQQAKQGIGGGREQTSSEIVDFKKYRTRVVSTANKANLDYNEAAPLLTEGLIRSISGLF
jgi:hypothetical protein